MLATGSAKLDTSSSRLVRYWVRPISRLSLRLIQVSGRIADPFLRCAVRVALYPYMLAIAVIGAFLTLYFIVLFLFFRVVLMVWAILDGIFGNKGPKQARSGEHREEPENWEPIAGELTGEKISKWHSYGQQDAAAGKMKHEPWAGPFEPHEAYEARKRAYLQGYNHALGQKDRVKGNFRASDWKGPLESDEHYKDRTESYSAGYDGVAK
jgi:hypothetical protein